jgi:hypothetical protein
MRWLSQIATAAKQLRDLLPENINIMMIEVQILNVAAHFISFSQTSPNCIDFINLPLGATAGRLSVTSFRR